MRRGRPRSVSDEVVVALLRFGVKPGVIAAAFGVHPKTIARARHRHVEETEPTVARFREALGRIRDGGHDTTCAPAVYPSGRDAAGFLICGACCARHVLEGEASL